MPQNRKSRRNRARSGRALARRRIAQALQWLEARYLLSANFFVSPSGSSAGDGSASAPWDLQTAMSQPAAVQPGDTIWLRGGTYYGGFTSNLVGTAAAPIKVENYPNEHVTIDTYNGVPGASRDFSVFGKYGRYQGFEIYSSDPTSRVSANAGSWPDASRGSLNSYNDGNEFVNLVVHDLDFGIGFWSGGAGGTIYGSIIYNNGWIGVDRVHGHGIYTQNLNGTKLLSDNIIFNQFAYGIHAYGTSAASLKGFDLEGNVVFNNGAARGEKDYPSASNILIGGDTPVQNVTLNSNYVYQTGYRGTIDFGYPGGPTNSDITLTNNYFTNLVRFNSGFNSITMTGDTILGVTDPILELNVPAGVLPSSYTWDNNQYVSGATPPFVYQGGKSFAAWQTATGLDAHSQLTASPASTPAVFVRPNQYEAGRGNIVVYNWGLAASATVDLSSVLQVGATYEIHKVENLLGPPILSGVYTGSPLVLPMTAVAPPSPIGYNVASPTTAGPEFGAFLVTSSVSSSNVPPTASAGGPYTVAEGGSVALSGTGASAAVPVTLTWDLDGDGTFGETGNAATRGVETGAQPTFNAAGLDGPSTRAVTLHVTDAKGSQSTSTATVRVTNVAPTVDAGGPYAVLGGAPIVLGPGPTYSDPGPDSFTFTWDLDGDGVFGETGGAALRGTETGLNPTFVPTNAFGQVPVTLRVTDDDGGVGQDTAIVTVGGAQFDFNYDQTPSMPGAGTPTPTQAGYTGVLPRNLYASVPGYGWVAAQPAAFDRNNLPDSAAQKNLLRDGAYGRRVTSPVANLGERTFRVDLANGIYNVNVTMGDMLVAHDMMRIKAEKGETTQVMLPLVSSPAGQFVTTRFTVQVIDGHLDLEFSDEGGTNRDWVVNGLEIRPAASLTSSILFDPPPAIVADGITPATFTASTNLANNSLVTVTTTAGTIVTPDADDGTPSYAGTQVKVSGGKISFAIKVNSTSTLKVTAISLDGTAQASATATPTLAQVRRFDFDAGAITAPGFTSVPAGTLYSASAGFGWLGPVSGADRTASGNSGAITPTMVANSPLRRDIHYGTGAASTFQIAVTPGAQYNVRTYVGDFLTGRNNIEVTVEGVAPYVVSTALTSLATAFDTSSRLAPLSASANGLLTVTIRQTGGNTWSAAGIEIWPLGATDPGIAQLQAAGEQGSGVRSQESGITLAAPLAERASLTTPALQPIVAEAIARWAATGLSSVQIAALNQVHFQIVDLGSSSRELGNAQPGLVQIDDDAAGHGWYIDPTPQDDREFTASIAATERQVINGSPAAGKMDLLTLVMHELGHELGLEDLSASSSPHNLMTENIGTGTRRVPAPNQASPPAPLSAPPSARDQVFFALGATTVAKSRDELPIQPALIATQHSPSNVLRALRASRLNVKTEHTYGGIAAIN